MATLRERIESDIRGWDAIPHHRTGTEGDRETTRWLAETIADAGVEATVDEFPFQRRVLGECVVRAGAEEAQGIPLFDCVGTHGAIRAPLSPVGRGTGIGVTRYGPTPAHAGTRALFEARRTNTNVGIVAISESPVDGLALLNADAFTAPFGPPVLQVETRHRDWLETAADAGAEAILAVDVGSEATTATNVCTEVPGRDRSLAPLVIMTPKSAWWTCTAERTGGIAIWLEAIRHFAATPPDRDVLFTANTGHELGHVGLDHYLQAHPGLVAGAHAWIHLGANFASVDSDIRFQASDPELFALGSERLEAHDVVPASTTPLGTRPGGEARNIFDGQGRFVSFLGSNRWFHHPDDRWPETIDIERTARMRNAVLEIADALARA